MTSAAPAAPLSLPIIDRARLAHRSMGNESLETELLSLFASETERLLHQVESAVDLQTRDDRIRAIGAAARGVGAARLAFAAQAVVQATPGTADPDSVAGAELDVLHHAVAEVIGFIRRARP